MTATSNPQPYEGFRRLSVRHFLVAEILLLVVVPFVDQLPRGELIESALFTLVLFMAMMAIGGRRKLLLTAAVLIAPAVLGRWIDHIHRGWVPWDVTNVASIIFVGFVLFHLVRYILRAPRVNSDVLSAGIASYLLLGILCAFAFMLISRLDPSSFAFKNATESRPLVGYEALFVSFGTLANVPYDEVSLVSKPVRMLAMAEAMTGMLYIATMIARLVSMYSGEEAKGNASAE
ncbi:MAG TPA: hypothetical protein VHR66_01220 [Gemmataceae bacterium]|jgi:hypothetical protein|nr:hypothetical protein [Gemmataceae bacterium]